MVWDPKLSLFGIRLSNIFLIIGSLECIFSLLYFGSELRTVFRHSYSDLVVICHVMFHTQNINVNVHQAMVCADYLKNLAITGCVVGSVTLLACILLLIGLYKNKSILMLPYLIAKGIGFLLLVILPDARRYLSNWAFTGFIGRTFVILTFIGGILSFATLLLLVIRARCNKKENQHTPAVSMTQNTREECTVTFKSPPTLETDFSFKSSPPTGGANFSSDVCSVTMGSDDSS